MKNILLLLADGFEFYEASVFIDVMGWNLLEGNNQTTLYTCGLHKEVNSTFNQKLIVDFTINEINVEDYDALAIPGGFEDFNFYKEAYSDEFSDLINAFYEKNKTIASICTGAFPIAKSGVLNGKEGTTYNLNPVRHNQLKEMGVLVKNLPIVVSDNIITSWNPSTAMDVAFLLLEKMSDKENANNVKHLMGFEI
ncbi:DJ-1 family protein [Flavobacteriaceae bacterium Ap0902]|nr:DJ-1 family protein [Flavobacteriaceae bacterium Ap0902]